MSFHLSIHTDDNKNLDMGRTGRKVMIFLLCISCIALGVFIGSYLIIPHWSTIIQKSIFLNMDNLEKGELDMISSLVAQNKIHTLDFIVERLIHFYETQIQCLVGFFAFFGLVGFFYIKFSHRRDITEEIHEYLNTNVGKLILIDIVKTYLKNENIKPLVQEVFNKERTDGDLAEIYNDISDIQEEIPDIKSKIEEILEEQTNLSDRIDNIDRGSNQGIIEFSTDENKSKGN